MKFLNLTFFVAFLVWGLVILSAVFLLEEQRQFDHLMSQEHVLQEQRLSLPTISSHRFSVDELKEGVVSVGALYPELSFEVKPLGYLEIVAHDTNDLTSFKESISMLSYRQDNVQSQLDGFCYGDACMNGAKIWGKISLFNIKVDTQ